MPHSFVLPLVFAILLFFAIFCFLFSFSFFVFSFLISKKLKRKPKKKNQKKTKKYKKIRKARIRSPSAKIIHKFQLLPWILYLLQGLRMRKGLLWLVLLKHQNPGMVLEYVLFLKLNYPFAQAYAQGVGLPRQG